MNSGTPERLTRWMLRHTQPANLDLDHAAQEDIAWAADEIEQLRKDKAKLDKALQLAKDMFIANDLSFPHTLEVIDDALNNHGASHD